MSNQTDISIVVEWENIALSKDERCFRMLSELSRQTAQIDHSSEIIVLYNPEQFDHSEVDAQVRLHFPPGAASHLRIEAAPGKRYYEMKNEGARMAAGEVVVFTDSDTEPEGNWLANISGPFFDNPEIKVLAGSTCLTHESLYEKAFALCWFFPLRNPENMLLRHEHGFFANNVAFRKRTIVENPFPAMAPGATRGACIMLARSLADMEIPIWLNTAARASHPPPNGFRHYLIRALAHGRDFLVRRQLEEKIDSPLRESFRNFRTGMAKTTKGLIRNRSKVDLPSWQVPFAFGIMAVYYGLVLAGSCLTMLFPGYARSHWRI